MTTNTTNWWSQCIYTGITIQTLVLYYVVKCAGFTHAHRCIHKHTQILHSADRTRQLPTLRRVSSLNTISCQLCAEQTRVMTRVHEAVLPSLSLTLIQLLSTMHPGSSSYKIPAVQLMSVCTIFFSSRDLLFVLIRSTEAGAVRLCTLSYSFRCVQSSTLHHTTWNTVRDSQ